MRNRFEEFVACAVEINRCIQRIKDQEMQRFGLRSRHTMCLYFLGCHPEGLSVGALADLTKEDKAAVSRSLDYLEKGGYITCGSGAGRRYRTPLYLTERGRAVCRAINEKIERIVNAASQGLGEAERRSMYRALTLISGNLERIWSAEQGGAEQI